MKKLFTIALLSTACSYPLATQSLLGQGNVPQDNINRDAAPNTNYNLNNAQYAQDTPISAARSMDSQIAQWLLADQRNIRDLAKFGLGRTKTPAVRQHAETIINDHSKVISLLEQVIQSNAQTSVTQPANQPAGVDPRVVDNVEQRTDRRQARREFRDDQIDANRDVAEARADRVRAADGVRTPAENAVDRVEDGVQRAADGLRNLARNAGDEVDRVVENAAEFAEPTRRDNSNQIAPWVSVHQQIANKVANNARLGLERRSGMQFDQAFLGMIAAAHLEEESTLEVLSQRASPDLRKILDVALQDAAQHGQKAEAIMTQLESGK